jgi:hypothetical protein
MLLRESLQSANLLTSQYARATLDCIFSMATDTFGQDLAWDGMHGPPACVINPHILKVIITALPTESSRVSMAFLQRTRLLCQSEASAQNCCKVEILGEILSHFGRVLLDVSHALHDDVKAIVMYLGECSISPGELKALLRLSADVNEHIVSPSVVKLLTAMAADLRGSRDADFIEFDMSRTGYASCFAPAIARIGRDTASSGAAGIGPAWQWPPPSGMSLSMWIRVMTHGMDEHPIRLATFFTPKPSGELKHLQLLLDPNDLELVLIGDDGTQYVAPTPYTGLDRDTCRLSHSARISLRYLYRPAHRPKVQVPGARLPLQPLDPCVRYVLPHADEELWDAAVR